jgi:hypothetical protein
MADRLLGRRHGSSQIQLVVDNSRVLIRRAASACRRATPPIDGPGDGVVRKRAVFITEIGVSPLDITPTWFVGLREAMDQAKPAIEERQAPYAYMLIEALSSAVTDYLCTQREVEILPWRLDRIEQLWGMVGLSFRVALIRAIHEHDTGSLMHRWLPPFEVPVTDEHGYPPPTPKAILSPLMAEA